MEKAVRDILKKCNKVSDFTNLSDNEKKVLNSELEGTNRLLDNNKFLGKNDEYRFITFNLPTKMTCPNGTKICKANCYQNSVEEMLKAKGEESAVVNFRKLNWYYSLQADFTKNMYKEIQMKRPKKKQQLVIRIHASGDFYSKEYLKKWMTIALATKLRGKEYHFGAYTKSFAILNSVLANQSGLEQMYNDAYEIAMKPIPTSIHKPIKLSDFNIDIIASVMDDTSPKDIAIINRLNLRTYTVTNKKTNLTNCLAQTCADCMMCYPMKKNVITNLR